MTNPQTSAEPAADSIKDDSFTALNLILVLVSRRRLIVITTGIAAAVLLAYSVLTMWINPESPWNVLPNRFTASVTVMITGDGPNYGSNVAASLLNQLPNAVNRAASTSLLAAGANKNAGLAQELLIGREILDALAKQQRFVTDASDGDEIALARERLEKHLATEYNFESDLLVISYEHFYPEEAASGLTFSVARLRDKMHRLTIDRVRRRKAFLEERIAAVEQDRETAQNTLIDFQQEFGVINLAAQSESEIQNLTILKTDLYRKEIELQLQVELLGDHTASVKRLRSEVEKIRTLIREIEHGFVEFRESSTSLHELPALGVRYLDLATELSVHDTIYAFLRSQYESTRIEENAKESTFQIVEPVEVPLSKSRPSRARICIVGTLAAFMASVLAALTMERFKRAESDPAQRAQLEKIRAEIGSIRKRTGIR